MTSPHSDASNSNQDTLSDLEALNALQQLLSELTMGESSPATPSEPLASEPLASEPLASEPLASEPLASEPLASEP
ncbi:MAG: hypothetical protein ACQERW_03355, partial [Cyanobacteriota bacterium]